MHRFISLSSQVSFWGAKWFINLNICYLYDSFSFLQPFKCVYHTIRDIFQSEFFNSTEFLISFTIFHFQFHSFNLELNMHVTNFLSLISSLDGLSLNFRIIFWIFLNVRLNPKFDFWPLPIYQLKNDYKMFDILIHLLIYQLKNNSQMHSSCSIFLS